MRCEKKSIGRRSTFQRYVEFPTTAIFPFIRSVYTVWTHDTASSISENPVNAKRNGVTQSGFSPVRSLSMNIRENPGLITPMSEDITPVSTTNTNDPPAPFSRFLTKLAML